jgi:hypothetical protein
MDWASRRRTKYFIVLIVLACIAVGFFIFPFLNRPPTCFDNKKNGDEAGIDCGGACQYLCGSQVSEPQIMWTRALPSANKRVALVTYLKNQNKTAGVAVAPYKFTVYDGAGKVIAIKEGQTQIPANGNIAIFAGPIDVGERKVQSTLFEWTKPLYFSSLSEKALSSKLETINTKLDIASTTTNLSVTLRNTTRIEYEQIPVVAILYDKDDNALLASRTILDNLPQESSTDIFFSWNTVPSADVATIEVLPYFQQFEKNNP